MTEAAPAPGWRGRLARWQQIIRYYQAGIVNLAFGYGLFSGLVAIGMAAYPAQALSHVLGMGFNYFTYSRHVFREAGPAKLRFVASYAINYLLSLALLALLKQITSNDYVAGFAAAIIVSVLNFFVLKHAVFGRKK